MSESDIPFLCRVQIVRPTTRSSSSVARSPHIRSYLCCAARNFVSDELFVVEEEDEPDEDDESDSCRIAVTASASTMAISTTFRMPGIIAAGTLVVTPVPGRDTRMDQPRRQHPDTLRLPGVARCYEWLTMREEAMTVRGRRAVPALALGLALLAGCSSTVSGAPAPQAVPAPAAATTME